MVPLYARSLLPACSCLALCLPCVSAFLSPSLPPHYLFTQSKTNKTIGPALVIAAAAPIPKKPVDPAKSQADRDAAERRQQRLASDVGPRCPACLHVSLWNIVSSQGVDVLTAPLCHVVFFISWIEPLGSLGKMCTWLPIALHVN